MTEEETKPLVDPQAKPPQIPNDDAAASPQELLDRLIRVEEGRLARDNRQIDVQEKALQVSNEQDQRQAEYHRERIRLEDAADKRRVGLVNKSLWIVTLSIALPLALLLFMLFWGDDSQRSMALAFFEKGLIGVAGYGVIRGLGSLAKAVTTRSDS